MVNWKIQCRKLRKSFGYAFSGIVFCLRYERNFRIHLSVALDVLLYSLLCELSGAEYGLLFLIIGAVLAAECGNTALENAIDLITKEETPLAKYAKDAAAGGVLLLALAAVGVGIALFYPFRELKQILASPILLPAAILLFIAELFFIFHTKSKNK